MEVSEVIKVIREVNRVLQVAPENILGAFIMRKYRRVIVDDRYGTNG